MNDMNKKNLVELFAEDLEKSKKRLGKKYLKTINNEIKCCIDLFPKETISGMVDDGNFSFHPLTIYNVIKSKYPINNRKKDFYFYINENEGVVIVSKNFFKHNEENIITCFPLSKYPIEDVLKWWDNTKKELIKDGKLIEDINDLVGKKLPNDDILTSMLKFLYKKDFIQYDSRIYDGIYNEESEDEYIMKDCYTVRGEEKLDIIIYYGNNTLNVTDVDVRK